MSKSKRHFKFPISILEQESDLILTSAASATYAPALADRLDAGLVAQGRTLWNTLFAPEEDVTPPVPPGPGSSAGQTTARGAVGTLTQNQRTLLKIYKPLAEAAREAGRKAFKGDNVKLHDEFRVGIKPSNAIDKIISDGRLLLTAVRNPANTAALKSAAGYIAKDATSLETALNNLANSESSQETAKGSAKGATDLRDANLNDLYDLALTIQSAAKKEFPDRQSQTAFRIGIFPPTEKSGGSGDAKPANNNPTSPSAPKN